MVEKIFYFNYTSLIRFQLIFDNTPLAAAGTSETREYMAYGVVDDNEIGQQSDIVSAVFGG